MRAQVFPIRAGKTTLFVGDAHPKPPRHFPSANCLFKSFIEFLGGCLEVLDQMGSIRDHVCRFRHTPPVNRYFLILDCTRSAKHNISFSITEQVASAYHPGNAVLQFSKNPIGSSATFKSHHARKKRIEPAP
jgi:hypothetical protein